MHLNLPWKKSRSKLGNSAKETKKEDKKQNVGPSAAPTAPATPAGSPPKVVDVTENSKSIDLWARAEQDLKKDKNLNDILEEAVKILERSGLQVDGSKADGHKQFGTFLSGMEDQLEEKKWILSERDQSIQKKATRVFRNVLQFKELVNSATSGSPPVAIACAAVSLGLLLYIQGVEQQESLLKGLDKTSALIPRMTLMERLYMRPDIKPSDDFAAKFETTLTSLFKKALEFLARALCHLQKHSFVQMSREVFKQDPWDLLIQDMDKLETEAEKSTHLLDAYKQALESEEQKQQKNARQVWKMTSERDARMNKNFQLLYTSLYREQKDRNKRRVPGTCEWFINHSQFRNWNENQGSGFLLVSADPGCGKSVLSRCLIDEVLQKPAAKRTVCYFFFKDDSLEQKSSANAISCILRQLLMAQSQLFTDSILTKFERDGDGLVKSFSDLWGIFMEVTKQAGEVVCVFDALDECKDEDQTNLIEAVTDLYAREDDTRNLKILMTSRPYSHIRSKFRELEDQLPTIHLSGEREEEVEKISKEIDLVIKSRIEKIAKNKRLTSEERGFLEAKMTTVQNRTYLWVALILEFLEREPGFTRGKVIRTVGEEMPQSVDGAYDKILHQSSNPAKGKRLLHVVVAAMRPLSLEELSLAMAIRKPRQSVDEVTDDLEPADRFKETMRDLCGLILTVVDEKVYLLHQTVKEFLVLGKSSICGTIAPKSWKYCLLPEDSHRLLAEICMWYIHGAFSSKSHALQGLMVYAGNYWQDHLRQCCPHEDDDLVSLAIQLCEPGSEKITPWRAERMQEPSIDDMEPLLHLACTFGLDAVVTRLLDRPGIDVNSRNLDGQTPLICATRYNHSAVVKQLIDTGEVDVNIEDDVGNIALLLAAREGYHEIVKTFLDAQQTNLSLLDSGGNSALSLAALYGHEETVRILLQSGQMDVNLRNNIDQSPIMYAAKRGEAGVVKILLNSGKVDLSLLDKGGNSAFSIAAEYGNADTVRLLLGTGKMDVNLQNSDVDLSFVNIYGYSALAIATTSFNADTVKFLLESGQIDVNSHGDDNRTPLFMAAMSGTGECLKLLLDTQQADLSVLDDGGDSVLSQAASRGKEEAVKMLLETGQVDMSLQNKEGHSAHFFWLQKTPRRCFEDPS
ncbi:hypothetical protein N7532_002486 [Penicillium argentinense]|uniref:NWD NACHT-NTPase N-terminal domain-containing protein n=1 Tax=Penicillium argentinense TaxID=1131581 RepID=A0A9W9G0F9_9EURO|nr:uncharacterized protein N7532_002486 [Penicillium argentinense]KAJ5109841.1 hypothetical protein N7532_002486 [Penicillium argentinense]